MANKPDCELCRKAYSEEFSKDAFGRCNSCEKMKRYRAALERRRKFVAGDVIKTMDELLAQEWTMIFDRPKHIKAVKNTQLGTVLAWLERGHFKKAIRKDMVDNG